MFIADMNSDSNISLPTNIVNILKQNNVNLLHKKKTFPYKKRSDQEFGPPPWPERKIQGEEERTSQSSLLYQLPGSFRQKPSISSDLFHPVNPSPHRIQADSQSFHEKFQSRKKPWSEQPQCPRGQVEFRGNSKKSFNRSLRPSKHNEEITESNSYIGSWELFNHLPFNGANRRGSRNAQFTRNSPGNSEEGYQNYFQRKERLNSSEEEHFDRIINKNVWTLDENARIREFANHYVLPRKPNNISTKLHKNDGSMSLIERRQRKKENETRKLRPGQNINISGPNLTAKHTNKGNPYKATQQDTPNKDHQGQRLPEKEEEEELEATQQTTPTEVTERIPEKDEEDLEIKNEPNGPENETMENEAEEEEEEEGAVGGIRDEITQSIEDRESKKLYSDLIELSSDRLVIYPEEFKCPICTCSYEEMEGVILQDCLHVFCRECLVKTIELCEAADVPCPFVNEEYACQSNLLEYEIKALLTEEAYDTRLGKTLALAEITQSVNDKESKKLYSDLMELSSDHLVIYPEEFECPICICSYEEMEGVILHDCLHVFCRECLVKTIELCEAAEVPCPFVNEEYACQSNLLEYEIKALLTEEAYDTRLAKTLALAEASMKDTFHCKTPDCNGWCINDGSTVFHCPVCSIVNCIQCKAIHEGLSCSEYEVVKRGGDINSTISEAAMRDMVASGEAMNCPNCNGIITKITGCDALTCTFCRAAICWATKGLRWGPNGAGDTSGGCRCNVNGMKCHPQCGNCH